MARMRKSVAYRRVERPYTRISKYRKKSFVRLTPNIKIVRFELGNPDGRFDTILNLVAKQALQIRQEAIESARKTSNKLLEKRLGKTNYYLKLRIYPFHVLRENPLASGAGADRFSTGMSHPFGKPIGVAARVKKNQVIMSLSVNKPNLPTARLALKRASYKLPLKYTIVSETLQQKETTLQQKQ